LLGKRTLRAESVFMPRAFTLVELLVVIAIVAVLAGLALAALPGLLQRAERADALAKIRTMGSAVLNYPADHGGRLPPLWPGQVLEFQEGRRKRIVTECAAYLGLGDATGSFLVDSLLPRAYAKQQVPADHAQMRVYVMNKSITNATGAVVEPFGAVANTNSQTLAAVAALAGEWMMQNADQQHPNVSGESWKANAPPEPPLGNMRAVFRFDGSAGLVNISQP
jgi:prepilin-type N-terminal cleavage/methylation domain-containing protein